MICQTLIAAADPMQEDRVMTHEITHAIMMHNCSPAIGDIPLWFIEGLAEAVHGNNRWTETVDKVAAAMSGFSNSVSGTNAYSMGYYAVSYMAYNTIAGTFKDFMQDMGSGLTFDELLKKYYGVENGDEFATMITDMVANEPGIFVAACHITLIVRLDNYGENLTESESKIRDTDMADLMTNDAKNNILCQSVQSMLVQANNINQGVLSLMQ